MRILPDTRYIDSIHESQLNAEVGLPLEVEQKYDMYFTIPSNPPPAGAAPALNWYSFAITQKLLTITSAGVTLV